MDQCKHPGCMESRVWHIGLCKVHYEQWIEAERVRLGPPGPEPTPEEMQAQLIKRYERDIKNHACGAITFQEMINSIHNKLVTGGAEGCPIADVVATLPDAIKRDLLELLRGGAEPVVWSVVPGPPPEEREAFYAPRYAKALAAQNELRAVLEKTAHP